MKIRWFRFALSLCICIALSVPGASAAESGAIPALQDVRVALFITTDKYAAASSHVTLSAEGGLSFGTMMKEGAVAPWLEAANQAETRFSLDVYRVFVAQTGDEAKAAALLAELQRAKQPGTVYEHTVKGNPAYRIYAGPFSSRSQADTVRISLAGNAAITKLSGGAQPTLSGPQYASAGSYSTEAEALSAAAALWDAGVFGVIAAAPNESGSTLYSVWIGETADEAQLKKAVDEASRKVSGISTVSVNAAAPYLIRRIDRSGTTATALGAATVHYSFGGEGHTVVAAPKNSGAGVRVKERSGRTYRGTVELSRYNNALAVVNRVPLESYVTSVVGSELDAAWPAEALKAQAVAARTYALKQGLKYGVAHVSDTTNDQSYRGIEREFPAIQSAVTATSGEVLMRSDGQLLDAFYHSNSGNMTADPTEVTGQPIAGISPVPSLDVSAERGKLVWYRVAYGQGTVGYVRSDFILLSDGTNRAGFPTGTATETVNVRQAPYVNNETNAPIGQLNAGDKVTIFGRDMESTSYQWIRGPVSAGRLLTLMASSGVASQELAQITAVRELEVSARGAATGRVTGMTVNDRLLQMNRPEHYRTLLGLPSTRFEVEETAKVTVLGSGGRTTALPNAGGAASLSAIAAGGRKSALNGEGYLITTGDGTARYATGEPQFRFLGYGFGHGLGMSQWGAFGLAELGYDYRKILQYYYKDATLVKG
ncbi:SpoIID/LytB domain-containing protein [Paenibacillus alkalitolerans]|uniref:SpoIID/LytB domain-containing protein n=1 Tax=Paenibacillus alkalitolerans TaxID=2799335 RepID=UPI0018F4B15C|nr:SpoIID/LytB domain-containing protein [Paenibacillus alkalitolerans]